MGICGSNSAAQPVPKAEEKPEIIDKRYIFGRTLGKGASCRVVEAAEKKNPSQKVAIKIMSKDKPICSQLYEHEVTILSKLKHKNIISFEGNQEDDVNYFIITKLCEGGELFDRIVNSQYGAITEKYAARLVFDMLSAIKYCHDQHIVHRDLKPENFVFDKNKEDAEIVLIDFGCAKIVEDEEEYKDLVGTVYYLAPELAANSQKVVRTGKVLKASDVWSLGVIAYVMLTGRPPFKGSTNKEIFTRIVKDPLKFPDDIELSESFKDFVTKALQKNPNKRITLEDALRHPWVLGKSETDFALNKDVIKYLRQFNHQSKLKKAIVRCLAANMSEEPEKEVKKHFARLDKDGDGYLDKGELKYLLTDLGYAPSRSEEEAGEILKQADLDNDGQIDFNEFKAIWHRKLLSQHEQYIHRVFTVFDDNNDGHIDAKELQAVLGEDGQTISEMIAQVDANSDQKINFEEFKKAMQENIDHGNLDVIHLAPGSSKVLDSDAIEEDIDLSD